MFQPAVFFEMGRSRSGTALVPYFDTVSIDYFALSTRSSNISVKWGDGNSSFYSTTKNTDATLGTPISHPSHTYAAAYTGNVEFVILNGLRDVYSLSINYQLNTLNKNKLNIQNFGTFIKQFPNLYSYYIFVRIDSNTEAMKSIIKGNLLDVPESIERIVIGFFVVVNPEANLVIDFSGLPINSKLKRFERQYVTGGFPKITGDLSRLPTTCNYFNPLGAAAGSSITYTAGKVWASSFDTLSIPLVLTTAELDNLLIDMNNSITTKIGAGVITLLGWRSAASDAAVASLQAKGFTVNVNRGYKLLDLPFQNSFADSGEMGMTMVAGGTSNQPTFALSGRKAGEYCAVFNGSQSIKTTTNLPVNSDKVTIAFWMKSTQTGLGMISELSNNFDSNNAFGILLNYISVANKIAIADHSGGYNIGRGSLDINNGNWFHVVLTIDRNLGVTQNQIYINGSLSYTQDASYVANLVGNFVNNILFIGQRAGSSLGFNGSITRFKIANYPFTPTEVTNLYNSEV